MDNLLISSEKTNIKSLKRNIANLGLFESDVIFTDAKLFLYMIEGVIIQRLSSDEVDESVIGEVQSRYFFLLKKFKKALNIRAFHSSFTLMILVHNLVNQYHKMTQHLHHIKSYIYLLMRHL